MLSVSQEISETAGVALLQTKCHAGDQPSRSNKGKDNLILDTSVGTRASSSSSHMHVINHNWSATKQRLHLQSVAEISRHSVLSGDRIRQCETSSGSRYKDTVSRHFLLQALQCPWSMWKRFSRDHCCRGRSKPGCRTVGSELSTAHRWLR